MRSPRAPAPSVLLDDVLVDGVGVPDFKTRAVSFKSSSMRAAGAQPGVESLRIAPGRHRLELVYTAVSFDAPERVRFRYQLEALDRDWVDAGTRRTAFYNYVPPGSYRFLVSACNSDGADCGSLRLPAPAWWRS